MRILIVDDRCETKCTWIKDILKQRNIEYEEISYLNGACRMIFKTTYDGIILDMQFPVLKDTVIERRAGEVLLKRMNHRNIKIPVLGNSTENFPSSKEYPFLKGNIGGYESVFGRDKLEEFLKGIVKGEP